MNKYGARKTASRDGHVFHSRKECNRYEDLLYLVKLGEITGLTMQVKWVLVPAQKGEREVAYFADFQYFDKEGKLHTEDVKGVRTKDYIIKRKLMLWVHGCRIEEM